MSKKVISTNHFPQGHPFMESLRENRPLLWSIALSGLAIVGLLSGSSPEFNEQFALVDIPTEVFNSVHYPTLTNFDTSMLVLENTTIS